VRFGIAGISCPLSEIFAGGGAIPSDVWNDGTAFAVAGDTGKLSVPCRIKPQFAQNWVSSETCALHLGQ
jgi:hypothetical protein